MSVSPNGCLLASVNRGINLSVWTHAVHSIDTQADKHLAQNKFTASVLVGSFKTLDEVGSLQWAPNSTLLAVLEPHRRVIEIFDAYSSDGKPQPTPKEVASGASAGTAASVAVARIDTGLNGATAILWHPSSRGIYWFGAADAFLCSLVDGTVMRAVDHASGVKVVRCLPLSSRPAASVPVLRSGATSIGPRGNPEACKVFSEAAAQLKPLMSCSLCGKWILAVTPRSQPILLSEIDNAPSSRCTPLVNKIADRPDDSTASSSTDANLAVEEHLAIVSTSTHDIVAAVPVAPLLLRAVTTMIPLLGGLVLLHDEVSRYAVVIRVEEREKRAEVVYSFDHVCLVTTSASHNVVIFVRHDWSMLDTLAFIEMKYRHMLPVPLVLTTSRLQHEAHAALVEEETPLHDATVQAAGEIIAVGGATTSRYAPMTTCEDAFTKSLAEAASRPHALLGGIAAVSDGGEFAALSPSWDLYLVIVIDIVGRKVHTVLRQSEPVTSLTFSRASRRKAFVAFAYESSNPLKLCITSDNHHGRAFLWSEDSASVLAIPLDQVIHNKADFLLPPPADTRGQPAMTVTRTPRSGVYVRDAPAASLYLSMRCGLVLWGASSAAVTLVDEQRGIFTTAVFGSD